MKWTILSLLGLILLSCGSSIENGGVTTYPFPEGMAKYQGVTMTAGGKNIDLYSVRANNTHSWSTNAQNLCDQVPVAMFDMGRKRVSVTITLEAAPSNVIVRPLGAAVPVVDGCNITFTLKKPGQYSVEWDNDPANPKNALLVFANPNETFTGTIVREAGIHVENIEVREGETLYLKPGAVIRGSVIMRNNSKIVGRGIIDGSHLDNWNRIGNRPTIPVRAVSANNIEINGISIFDPNAWTVELLNTSNVSIKNLKIISSRCNSDGISIQSSNSINIKDSFLRTWDDSVVLKNYTNKNTYKINVTNCIFWTDLAQTMEIGVETNKGNPGPHNDDPRIYDVKFENIRIFHALHKAPISIHNGDNANIFNIRFRNIVIENYQAGLGDGWNYLIDFTNLTGQAMGGAASWTSVRERGNMYDICVDNVKIIEGRQPNARFNSSQGGSIHNVTVRKIYKGSAKLDFSRFANGDNLSKITFR